MKNIFNVLIAALMLLATPSLAQQTTPSKPPSSLKCDEPKNILQKFVGEGFTPLIMSANQNGKLVVIWTNSKDKIIVTEDTQKQSCVIYLGVGLKILDEKSLTTIWSKTGKAL